MLFTAVELRASNEDVGTDHTGDIVSLTAVGTGAGTDPPRPWVCFTLPLNTDPDSNVQWQTPDGANIARMSGTAPDNSVITRTFSNSGAAGVVLSRGTGYFSPDGDYCCVLTIGSTETRRCVTFSEY